MKCLHDDDNIDLVETLKYKYEKGCFVAHVGIQSVSFIAVHCLDISRILALIWSKARRQVGCRMHDMGRWGTQISTRITSLITVISMMTVVLTKTLSCLSS